MTKETVDMLIYVTFFSLMVPTIAFWSELKRKKTPYLHRILFILMFALVIFSIMEIDMYGESSFTLAHYRILNFIKDFLPLITIPILFSYLLDN